MTTVIPAARLSFDALAPGFLRAAGDLDAAAVQVAERAGLPLPLRELVRLRSSQLNGCAYCVDLHSRDAREAGAGQQRVDALTVWRESALFDARERAALDLAEHITLVAEQRVPEHVVACAVEHLGPEGTSALLALVVAVNVWNAIGVTTRCWPTPPRADT